MEKVKEVLQFLEDSKVFYVSTVDDNKPRVRPFSGIHEFEGKLYMPTSNKKKVFEQMMKNPNVEISGMAHGKWIRIEAEIVCDKSVEARKSMLDHYNRKDKYGNNCILCGISFFYWVRCCCILKY